MPANSDSRPSALSHHDSRNGPRGRRLRLLGIGAALVLLLGGCTLSPEAARVRGEPGADPGNHGDPVVLLAPPDRFTRIFTGIPFEGPQAASEDTAQS